jgi:hypothetical protein
MHEVEYDIEFEIKMKNKKIPNCRNISQIYIDKS